jgi:hypothetical protein
MWKWLLMALCIFTMINWWLLPTFPRLQRVIPVIGLPGAIGLAAIFVIGGLLFARNK